MHLDNDEGRSVKGRRTLSLAAMLCGLLVWAAPAAAAPPVNTSPPTITGTPRVGETLTAQNGTWENSPSTFTYQWQRCDANGAAAPNIAGATAKTYQIVNADAGDTLRVRVTAIERRRLGHRGLGSDSDRVVERRAAQHRAADDLRHRPHRADADSRSGQWTGSPTSFAFQWQRCDIDVPSCFDVAGATSRRTCCGSPTSASACGSR